MKPISEAWEWLVAMFRSPGVIDRLQRELDDAKSRLLEERKLRDYHASMVNFEEGHIKAVRCELQRELKSVQREATQ